MKKLIALTLVMMLVLVGCSSTETAVNTKTGLGVSNGISSSKNADTAEGTDGLAQADITTVALTVDDNGVIQSISVDAIQPKIYFDEEGNVVTDLSTSFLTKKELKDDYGMRKASPIGAEWFEQIAAFEEWATGKTVDEVLNMETQELPGHPQAVAEPELIASCTIDVGSILEALDAANKNAK